MVSIRAVLSGTLLVSAAIGWQIVLTDKFLLTTAPSHAYGLALFITLDIALAIALWRKLWLGSLLSMGLAIVQAIAMLLDVFTYSTPYTPQQVFRTYLLSTPAFIILLFMQAVILVVSLEASNPRYDYTMIRRFIHTISHRF